MSGEGDLRTAARGDAKTQGARGFRFQWGADGREVGRVIDTRAAVAELVGMTLFVAIGCGTACAYGGGDSGRIVLISFAFGMTILSLAYALGHLSGGQMNCAVTFSLVLGGALPWYQGLVNLVMQCIGSILGALWVAFMFPCHADMTQGLATNSIDYTHGDGRRRAFAGEVVGTFLLCWVVWETAVSPRSKASIAAPIAIGFAVFLAHVLLIPIDGCSINPTRSLGPALIAPILGCEEYPEPMKGLTDLWLFWVLPLIGAALAAGVKTAFLFERRPAGSKGESKDEEAYCE